MQTICVSGLEVVLIGSGVDVLLGEEKLNSSSEDQETDNTTITRPLNELLPVHPLTVHRTDTHNTTHEVPPSYTNHTHTLLPPSNAHTHSHFQLICSQVKLCL